MNYQIATIKPYNVQRAMFIADYFARNGTILGYTLTAVFIIYNKVMPKGSSLKGVSQDFIQVHIFLTIIIRVRIYLPTSSFLIPYLSFRRKLSPIALVCKISWLLDVTMKVNLIEILIILQRLHETQLLNKVIGATIRSK